MLTAHELQFSFTDDIMVVHLPAQAFSQLELVELDEQWLAIVDQYKPTRMVVDFNLVTLFSSQAVGTLIRVSQRVRASGGDIKLCSMSPRICEIFRICRLVPGSFELFASQGDAVNSFIDVCASNLSGRPTEAR